MSWSELPFANLWAEKSRNGIYKRSEFHGRGTKIVNMGEMFAYDFIGKQKMKLVDLTENEIATSGLKNGDLLFGRRSLVEAGAGKCSLVCDVEEDISFESSIIRVRPDNKKVNPLYLYYFFKSPIGRGRISAIVSGTNVKGIRSSDLARISIRVPDNYEDQNRLCSVISAYDKLIANNERRIVLLEQLARELYEEWFVRFRYPGYMNDTLLDGVPSGWTKKKLGEVAKTNRESYSARNLPDEINYIEISSVSNGRIHSFMGSIFVLDRSGILVADSRSLKMKPENHSGKEYFQVYQKGSNLENYISHPWIGQNGEYQISISRRISGADNSFQGVVVGTLKLSYFHDLFRKLRLSEGDVLFLISTDGTMIMRTPFDIDFIGRDVSKTAISQQMSQAEAGSYDAVAGIDGIKRLYVYQRIGKHPLRIGYGQSHDNIYAGWRHEAWRLGLMVFLVCAMNITLIVFLARTLKSRGRAEDALAVSSTTDSLTGLCNRRRFDEIFEQEWRRAQRTQSSIAMCMIDADEFKSYNDRFGHQAGDAALVAIADCIAMGTRRGADFGARYGGEEFVVLLPGKSTEEAFEIAENIRSAVLSLRAHEQGREDSLPTISSGVASVIPRQGLEMSSLLKAADMALYQAKSRGRDRTERASECRLVVMEEKRIAA